MSRVTKRDSELIEQLVIDCDIYNFREREALEYIKSRLGRAMSGRTYRRYKTKALDGRLSRDWMNRFTRTGYVIQHLQLFFCARHLLESSMRRLLAEEKKQTQDDDLMLHLSQDIRENIKAVYTLSQGPTIVSALDARFQELEDKITEQERSLSSGPNGS